MDNKEKVVLKAEVLASGKGCPVCGGEKTEKAKTCRPCLTNIGSAATKAVNAIAEVSCDALFANAMANSGDVVRGTVWGPFLANTRIDIDAKFTPAKNDIGAHWHCKRGVPGGYMSIFIFGDNLKAGQEVCGLAELKIKHALIKDKNGKVINKKLVHYMRMQTVEGVKSDFRLSVLEPQEIDRLRHDYLQATVVRNDGYDFAVGFLPMKNGKREEDEKIAATV